MQTIIKKGAPVVTLINVFTVEPGQQAALVELLDKATQDVMRHIPGFVSANLHRSLDGKTVANYAQWRSREDFEAMLKDPKAKEHMDAALKIATIAPGVYEVAAVHARPAD